MPKIEQVLLVDDDYVANYVNQDLIREMNIADQVRVIDNGRQAIAFLEKYYTAEGEQSDSQHLILLDINMPAMDGFEFLDELRKYPFAQKIHIVLLTTSDNAKDIEKAGGYAVSGYLYKPLTEDKLNDVISRMGLG